MVDDPLFANCRGYLVALTAGQGASAGTSKAVPGRINQPEVETYNNNKTKTEPDGSGYVDDFLRALEKVTF